ncbi:Gfo/Idh/MocA family protein [Parahaliea mediterranea]|uniref:Gfo/Idh/MocA family oxidoreductase n=1 Tax=Parahaliea mediterranea TaxID=651086 RepID=A0A939DC06_9GAMM|nr:Gfo/Idh/MocA family oxidoreductase [Parahaliea mediterranea]MBN7795249.1 Gfo/Idh/MocA family oxidoreductase [Parahaliea mediterranea]
MLRIGIVGYGYWGPNLVRNFSTTQGAEVKIVADLDPARLARVKQLNPAIEVTADIQDLLANPDLDAVAIATPVSTHYELALQALRANKHVFVEKPIAENSEQTEHLIEEAEKRDLVLHVDHTFIYTGAVRKMRDLVRDGEIGDIYYYDSTRVNLGLFQSDVNVMWDLAVHDLSIMDYVLPSKVTAVSASGVSHLKGQPANVAYLTVFFEDNCIAHLHVNWLSPVKLRKTLLGGSRKMIVYDDLEPSEKIKIYDKGITLHEDKEKAYQQRVAYRSGDMLAPELDIREALQVEAEQFLRCINENIASPSNGQAGLRVLRILEAATVSLSERGRPVKLGWNGRGMKVA